MPEHCIPFAKRTTRAAAKCTNRRTTGQPATGRPIGVALMLVVAVLAAGCSTSPGARSRKTSATRLARRASGVPVEAPYVAWGDHSVETRLADFGSRARARWKPYFQAAGVAYPAGHVVLAAFKRERRIDVYAGPSPSELSLVRRVEILAASGRAGPKLREGDRQVPEGIYEIDLLNPNSLYHVAMHVNYPNDFDRHMAIDERRHRLGGQIMIHGSDVSIGCIAVGDQASEDLFTLAADTGLAHVALLIAPRDFRRTGEREPLPGQPAWVRALYADLERRLDELPVDFPVSVGSTRRSGADATSR